MDEKTSLENLKLKIKDFCEARDWDQFHTPKELAIAISIEAGEVLEHFRFIADKDLERRLEERKEEISEELADIFWFLLRYSQLYDIDLIGATLKKLEKNEKRFPVEKFKGSNKKYNES